MQSEAVWLLSERAAAVLPGFAVNPENAAAVRQLTRRLDGIPLALELAAVRLGALSLDQLNQGLERELSILGSGTRGAEARQQTLEATIGWSFSLLDEVERVSDQLAMNKLVVTDQVKEYCSKRALAYICESQIGTGEGAKEYARLARQYHSQADYLASCMRVAIDVAGDGSPWLLVDLSCTMPVV